MFDGSLQKDGKTLILNTQSYTLNENNQLCYELNQKFGLLPNFLNLELMLFHIKIFTM